jgi:hypothetical protein
MKSRNAGVDDKNVMYIAWCSIAYGILKQLLITNISCEGFYFSKSFYTMVSFTVSK